MISEIACMNAAACLVRGSNSQAAPAARPSWSFQIKIDRLRQRF